MSDDHGASRRKFLKQAGTAAWAAPLILTAAAGRAGAQVGGSCSPTGIGCGTWNSGLNICVPNVFAAPCCNDCVRGEGAQSQFCFCT